MSEAIDETFSRTELVVVDASSEFQQTPSAPQSVTVAEKEYVPAETPFVTYLAIATPSQSPGNS